MLVARSTVGNHLFACRQNYYLSLSLSLPPSLSQSSRARTPEIKIQRESESHIVLGTGYPSSSPRSSPANSRGSTPERSSPKHVKGTRAKFIRQNPRFINNPICTIVPCEGGKSVAECLDWKQETVQRHKQTAQQ